MLGRLSSATNQNKRAIIAMSGGVDSSVAAALLSQQSSYTVQPVFMRNWDTRDEYTQSTPGGVKGCEWEIDYANAKAVCTHLNLPQPQLVDLSSEYWLRVFSPSLDIWRNGQTPNPDIACNRHIKFDALAHKVLKGDDDVLVTGHYAQVDTLTGTLSRAVDRNKDQSYYLSAVNKNILNRVLLPLGSLHKQHTRFLAHSLNLPNANRDESMGICFIGERRHFGSWLDDYIHTKKGLFITPHGHSLGEHNGLHHYTIGQKARIGGVPKKLYVAAKKGNDVVVVDSPQHNLLKCKTIITHADINWLVSMDHLPNTPFEATAQVRHRQLESRCTVQVEHDHLMVNYQHFEMAVAPGQTCAIYMGDVCIASATIDKTISVDGILH
ncbi:hypothetical protein E3P86_01695 [Wallemia ichthyophaga]|uniref:tRNA-5-taurinomethyluridine 2-sulfurtransferase n=1 Tax=Wallemia ichthyophaga TaxID=245174 RepID=A0A4V4M5S5_WALIC|nr:hypothetical protein E3P86_01695 [Wallemia ichthyophaga]